MVDAREYHERTNHTPRSVRESGVSLDPRTRPRPFKRYADLRVEPLAAIRPPIQPALAVIAQDRAAPLAGAGQPPPDRAGRETLATLCYEAAGVTETVRARDGTLHHFRAASCTGNLHHVDLYLVCGALADLDAGLYHFDPASFALDVVREGDYRGALAGAVGTASSADADADAAVEAPADADRDAAATVRSAPLTVVATSTWARNAWKYRERTYRHAFWDSGTILANLLATAHALDYRADVLASFADHEVAELLGIAPEREAPIAVVPVGSGGSAPESPPVEPVDPAVEPPTDDPADAAAIHDAWAQSALPDAGAAAAFRRECRETGPVGLRGGVERSESGGDEVELDAVDPATASARPLHHAIRRRGSCREFDDPGPSRRQVATVLDRALRGVPADWRAERADEPAGLAYNDAYLLATGVDDLGDGAYHVDLRSDRLVRLGDVDPAATTHLALDQGWAGDAHANVYLLADVDAVVAALGNRGYRLAQLEAGIALGRLYLATYAHREFGGTGLTFYDDLVAERLAPTSGDGSVAGSGQTPTCLFAFGTRAD